LRSSFRLRARATGLHQQLSQAILSLRVVAAAVMLKAAVLVLAACLAELKASLSAPLIRFLLVVAVVLRALALAKSVVLAQVHQHFP